MENLIEASEDTGAQDWTAEPADTDFIGDGISDDSTLDLFAKDAEVDEVEEAADEPADDAESSAPEEGSDAADDAPTFTIKVGGETKTVTQDELIALAQQGEDYTRKTQALAEERQRYASYQALEEALQRDPAGTLRMLQAAYDIKTEEGEADTDVVLDPLEAEVAELRAWREQQEAVARQTAVQRELESIAQTYDPDLNQAELLQFAMDHQIGNLEVAYKAMAFEQRKAEAASAAAAAAQERQSKVEAKRQAAPVEGGSARPKAAVARGGSAKPSLRDAFFSALGS